MSAATTAAEDRLGVILSNQYNRRMQRNRPEWYKSNPLDTAPKVFASWRRNHVPLIRDWETCHRVVAKKAAWMGKVFADKYYETNGVIWGWDDPASKFLVELFTSTMETVEFAISADSFWAPHIVVTHSPGDEPEYLDSHCNPDQLTDSPRRKKDQRDAPIPEGYTPRQSYTGPTGLEQLFLPPRQHMLIERKDWTAQCAEATADRYRAIQKLSVQFHIGLERIRSGQQPPETMGTNERGRDPHPKAIAGSCEEQPDFAPTTKDGVASGGWGDADAASSLLRRGIMFQMSLADLAEMADSAILSDDEDEAEESVSLPSPSIAEDTYDVLCKLGMVYGADEEDDETKSQSEEDDDDDDRPSPASLPHSQTFPHDTYAALCRLGVVPDDEDDENSEDDADESESEDEQNADTQGLSISNSKAAIFEPVSASSRLDPAGLHASNGSLDLVSVLVEERSSVSSLSEEESIASGCETPDTEDYGEC